MQKYEKKNLDLLCSLFYKGEKQMPIIAGILLIGIGMGIGYLLIELDKMLFYEEEIF